MDKEASETITISFTALEFQWIAAAVQGETLPWKIAHPLVIKLQEAGAAKAAELVPPADAPPAE